MRSSVNIILTGRQRGFWLIRPTVVLYRLGLRRLAIALAVRFVGVDVYADDRFLCRVGLESHSVTWPAGRSRRDRL